MQLDPENFDDVWNDFAQSWDLKRVKQMTIEGYSDLGNKDSFCYWLEYGTPELGQIGGVALNKFELWQPKDEKDFKDKRFLHDGRYAWNATKGATAAEAFENIKALVISIVELTERGDWKGLDHVKYHSIARWKIAFLFSGKRLFPVYSQRALLAIARGLGKSFTTKDPLSEIQLYILDQKPADEGVVAFAHRTYTEFAEKDKIDKRNYYIIGSKYGGNDTIPVMPKFLKNQCVAMGFLDWLDFSEYIGKQNKVINEWVEENYTETKPTIRDVKSYFRLLSQMKEGDIIAIKSHGAYNSLTIVGYAQVVKRDGSVYEHNEDELGHHIHVDFLDAGFERSLGLNYAKTIHKLTPDEHGEHFNLIFGWYAGAEDAPGSEENETQPEEEPAGYDEADGGQTVPEGYNEKNETPFERSATASVIVNRVHNRIQNRFMQYLAKEYPDDIRSGEKGYIDARRENETDMVIYEIKPFASVYGCVRNGIGQLFDYTHSNKSSKQKKIVIVGPSVPGNADLAFIAAIRNMLNLPFGYLAFNDADLTATEY